ncbi:MAG: hypothetical protein Q8O12_02690 [Candidatus Omnitrophota bacterium]|nr:hypothetical protein [Candidatus Omnitrophota bacterium]
MDKTVFKVTSIRDKDDHGYWIKKSYLERIAALEQLRKVIFGYDSSTARLQRTFTVTELKKN